MHKIWTIAIDDPGVCQSICHTASLCKTAKQIETLFVLKRAVTSILLLEYLIEYLTEYSTSTESSGMPEVLNMAILYRDHTCMVAMFQFSCFVKKTVWLYRYSLIFTIKFILLLLIIEYVS